jgi:hypothetical protein
VRLLPPTNTGDDNLSSNKRQILSLEEMWRNGTWLWLPYVDLKEVWILNELLGEHKAHRDIRLHLSGEAVPRKCFFVWKRAFHKVAQVHS